MSVTRALRSTLTAMKAGKRLNRSTSQNFVIFLFLAVCSVFMALPLVYTVVTALKPMNEIFLFPPRFFVMHPTTDNFLDMIQLTQSMWVPFSRYLFNSLFVAFAGTAFYILISSMAAFSLSKYNFPGHAIYFQIVVWAILFRPEVTGIPQYIIISKLGMVNTYWAVILPVLAGSFGVFLMRQFMIDAIPNEMIEAARIDGASEYKIFWRIVMPIVRPAWLTLLIFTFQQFWNTTGVQYIYDENLKMLPTILQQIASAGLARAGAGSAVAVVLMVPPIVIFLISQSSVMKTMAHSGLK